MKGKKGIYLFCVNFFNFVSSQIKGTFVATDLQVKTLIESEIDCTFGIVLDKYIEISGPIEPYQISLITDDEGFIKIWEENSLCSGYNPFECMVDSDVEEHWDMDYLQTAEYLENKDEDFEIETVRDLVDYLNEQDDNK